MVLVAGSCVVCCLSAIGTGTGTGTVDKRAAFHQSTTDLLSRNGSLAGVSNSVTMQCNASKKRHQRKNGGTNERRKLTVLVVSSLTLEACTVEVLLTEQASSSSRILASLLLMIIDSSMKYVQYTCTTIISLRRTSTGMKL
jgi:hypothetical protein